MSSSKSMFVVSAFVLVTSVARADRATPKPAIDVTLAASLGDTLAAENGMLELRGVVSFEAGRLRVYSKSREKLQDIATAWKRHNDWSAITVDGFADTTSNAPASLALAQLRADLIRSYLIRYGVGPEYIQVVGHVADKAATPALAGKRVDLSIRTCANQNACARSH